MNVFKIYGTSDYLLKHFQSLQDAESWRDGNKPSYSIKDLGPSMYMFSISNEDTIFYKKFLSLQDAQYWRDQNKPSYQVQEKGLAALKIPDEIYQSDKDFLKKLGEDFDKKNRAKDQSFAQIEELQTSFGPMAFLSERGAIKPVKDLLLALNAGLEITVPIGGVYTQERRLEDLEKINAYLIFRLYK